MLTDGQVSNNQAIIDFVKSNNHAARFHTFGIGTGCSAALINEAAVAGRGSAYFAKDNSPDLPGQVVNALRRSFEPSLAGCFYEWDQHKT